MLFGYANDYYFHLRKFAAICEVLIWRRVLINELIGHHKNNAH